MFWSIINASQVPDASQASRTFQWDFGLDLATALLHNVHMVACSEAPYKIETKDFKVYWAGSVLRVDIDTRVLADG